MTSPDSRPSEALKAPAAARNREPILAVLREALPAAGLVLEIASGTGEHAMWFASALPTITWQPTDRDDTALASIEAWRARSGLANVLAPQRLDAAKPDFWPVSRADAIVAVNMIHIAPWEAALGLLAGAGKILPPGGLLYLYGPFIESDVATADSNLAFDADLRARDLRWGLRKLDDVLALGAKEGLVFDRLIRMPANNLSVLLRKEAVLF